MAASASAGSDCGRSWTSGILCRYFLHGVCSHGTECSYSHDLSTAKQDSVCRYYLRGACTYGEKCRYDHVKPNNASEKGQSNCPVSKHQHIDGTREPQNKSICPSEILNRRSNSPVRNMVTLKKGKDVTKDSVSSTPISPGLKSIEEWVQAAEFTPGQPWKGAGPTSYLDAAQTGLDTSPSSDLKTDSDSLNPGQTKQELCPYALQGECRFAERCTYLHGDICDICGKMVLLKGNKEQNEAHQKECLQVLEDDMELSFAIQRSKDKVCGICMETVMEKKPAREQRFGILSHCNHVFCLSCIRTWRQAKSFENKIVRACPQCRVNSDFVTPSQYWVEQEEEKQKLIEGYKTALRKKPCKHFDEGRGECPFNEHCFYLHAYPDGRLASPKPRRRRQYKNAEGELELVERILLWDFLEERSLSTNLDDEWEDIFLQLNLMDTWDTDSEPESTNSEDEFTLDFLTL